MSFFSRRGAAALAVASVLIFAPLATTAAFADDEPVVEAPVIETPSEEAPAEQAPAAPAEEAPAAPAAEAPAAEAPAADAAPAEEPVEEPATDAPVAPMSFSPMSLAPAYDCDYSSTTYAHYALYPFCVDESSDGTSATVFWTPINTGYTNYFYVFDVTNDNNWVQIANGSGFSSPFDYSTIPGHTYRVWLELYNGGSFYVGQLNYTAAALPPAAPTALTATRDAGANAIDLSWTASVASEYNPLASYRVDATATSTGVVSSSTSATTAFEATGLTVGEEYTFTVTAVGQNGELSPPTTTVATLEAIAPTAATSVVLSRSDETLSAAWAAPTYDGGVAAVTYDVDLYAGLVKVESHSQTGTSITFDEDAEFSVHYTVVVTATTTAGDAPTATSNTVTRADSVPGTPVAFAEGYGYKDAMIYASWDLTVSNGSPLESIDVTVYDTLGAVVAHKHLPTSATSWSFHNFANDTDYTVGVVVSNAAGASAESARVPVTTLGLIPPAPTAADLTPANNFADVTVGLTGTTLTAHINGLDAGDWVFGTAYSTPFGLGWTQVDAAGTATWSIAAAKLPAGAHTLAVQNTFGALLGSAGFTVAAAPSALAHAGTDPSGTTTLAVGMLALGLLVTATRIRRRARA